MKKISKVLVAVMIFVAAAQAVNAQLVVRIRPTHERVVRVAAPSPRHVWVDEDWRWENNNYVYTGGHWVEPPAGHHRWVAGHWQKRGREGWVWKEGHWR